MPSPTVEQLQKKEISLKKALADLGETPDQTKQRSLRKQLKRTQRRRRLDVTLAARNAPKPKAEEPKVEAKAEPKPKAEEPKVEAKAEPKAEAPKEAPAETPAEESKEE